MIKSGWKLILSKLLLIPQRNTLTQIYLAPLWRLRTIFLVVRGGALSPRQPYHCPHLISVIARARILHHKFYQSHTEVEIMEH